VVRKGAVPGRRDFSLLHHVQTPYGVILASISLDAIGILSWDKLDILYVWTSYSKTFSTLRFLVFFMGENIVHIIRKVRVLCCVCRKGTGPSKSDEGNKKDDDKDHIPVREFEEDTNDRYTA
jgi:hypothetical protein